MGYLVVGDIHNEIHYMRKVVDYAVGKDLQLIFVGDLVDYGPAPAEEEREKRERAGNA